MFIWFREKEIADIIQCFALEQMMVYRLIRVWTTLRRAVDSFWYWCAFNGMWCVRSLKIVLWLEEEADFDELWDRRRSSNTSRRLDGQADRQLDRQTDYWLTGWLSDRQTQLLPMYRWHYPQKLLQNIPRFCEWNGVANHHALCPFANSEEISTPILKFATSIVHRVLHIISCVHIT